jgi:hypothetical protein
MSGRLPPNSMIRIRAWCDWALRDRERLTDADFDRVLDRVVELGSEDDDDLRALLADLADGELAVMLYMNAKLVEGGRPAKSYAEQLWCLSRDEIERRAGVVRR